MCGLRSAASATTNFRYSRALFDHPAAQYYFGASVFWVRLLAAFGGEEVAVGHWQIKRDGELRGIVEVV